MSDLVGTGPLKFEFTWDASVANAPAGFVAAVETAAENFSRLFRNRAVINIDVGYGEVDNHPMDTDIGGSFAQGDILPWSAVVADLQKVNPHIPTASPFAGGEVYYSLAELKAIGYPTGVAPTTIDGYIGLSSTANMDWANLGAPAPGQYDAVLAAEHEIAEVLGRFGGDNSWGWNVPSVLDTFRYTAPGVMATSPGPAYFSLDGGKTNLANFGDGLHEDGGDFLNTPPDVFDAFITPGVAPPLSSLDIKAMQAIGYKPTPTGWWEPHHANFALLQQYAASEGAPPGVADQGHPQMQPVIHSPWALAAASK